MKYKVTMALLAGLLCMVQRAQAQTFSPPWNDPIEGYMIVYNDEAGYLARPGTAYWDGGGAGSDITGPKPLGDLVTLTSDYYTFDFLPETNKYYNGGSGGASFWQNGAGDGGKYLECLTYWGKAVTGIESDVLMEFTINSNTFDTNRYDFAAFIRVVNVADGTALTETNLNLNSIASGSYTLSLTNAASYVGAPLQAGFRVLGTNANPANAASYGGANITVDDLLIWVPCDPIPPSPDPMTWAVEPYTISDDKIGMTATTATDLSGVEYQFVGYTTFPGPPAFVSDWQDSPHYVASGLLPSTTYTIRARAQDLAVSCGPNATGFTTFKTATTLAADTTAPSPDPAEIASITASPISVWLTATPATDASAVEYNFVPSNTNNNAVASGWQASNEYVAYGLVPETEYTYTVQVRDLSAATNTTAVSAPASATTLAAPFSGSLINDLKGFPAGSSTSGSVVHELAMAGFELATLDASKPVYVDGTGMTFGNYLGDNGTYTDRNILRTIASDYGDNDFQITVTFAYSNQNEQVCHVGAGQGLQGQYNVPDFFLEGVSGVLAETSNAGQKLFGWFEGALQDIAETNGITTLTNRVRLTYNASATTAIYEIDYDADGLGGFEADLTLGPISLTNVWQTGAPQKVYIGGGAGTRLYDLEVVYSEWPPPPPPPFDFSIVSVVGDTATLQWTGSSDGFYDIVYKTNLADAFWTPDPANTFIPGADGVQQATSLVPGDAVFYRLEAIGGP